MKKFFRTPLKNERECAIIRTANHKGALQSYEQTDALQESVQGSLCPGRQDREDFRRVFPQGKHSQRGAQPGARRGDRPQYSQNSRGDQDRRQVGDRHGLYRG